MGANVDYRGRLAKIQGRMDDQGLDALVATRLSTVGYVFGGFVPWRSVAIIPRQGEPELYVVGLDAERLKDDCFFKNVNLTAPFPGMTIWDQALSYLRARGLENGAIGVELGHSPIRIETFLLASEQELLRGAFPEASLVSATDLMNDLFLIKDEAEIESFRRAAEICDLGMAAVLKELRVGMTETEVAGVAEHAMRAAGSELNWTFTGGQEIASGYRTAYNWGGCTPPSHKRIQRGDNVVLDLHAMYNLYLGDLSHNAIVGQPSPAQKELADIFVAAGCLVVDSLRPGVTYGEVAQKVEAFLDKTGYRQYAMPGYGHGIGIVGNEWYPLIVNSSVPCESNASLVLQPNMVEIAAIVLNKPGVGGMRMEMPVLITPDGNEPLNKTPIEPTVIVV